jgi:hypothetical protein
MTLKIEGHGEANKPMICDTLLRSKVFNSPENIGVTDETRLRFVSYAEKLAEYAEKYPFLPCDGKKRPLISSWQKSEGLTINQCLNFQGCKAIGVKTGLNLLCLDVDGESAIQFACDIGLEIYSFGTWYVGREKNFSRFKLFFTPTKSQIAELKNGEFQSKRITKPPVKNSDGVVIEKGEALEVFLTHKRYAIVLGEHPENDNYDWHNDSSPDDLIPPPPEVWNWVKSMEPNSTPARPKNIHRSGTTKRLNPCPICGRDDRLWCEESSEGLIFCMVGSTFSAELKHGRLRVGSVVNGYACVSKGDECLTFKRHQPRRNLRPKRIRRTTHA